MTRTRLAAGTPTRSTGTSGDQPPARVVDLLVSRLAGEESAGIRNERRGDRVGGGFRVVRDSGGHWGQDALVGQSWAAGGRARAVRWAGVAGCAVGADCDDPGRGPFPAAGCPSRPLA